ncbi:MAG: hypothetical protein LBI90_06945 [Treponema sp.]|jgi:hypothetical protein|nr:hypothetical protein [Treponema sp.]
MDPLTLITTFAGLAGTAARWIRDAAVTDDGFIRAYYLEVSRNIEILKAIDIAALKDTDINAPQFRSLIGALETGVGASLLCTGNEKRKKILTFLKAGLEIQPPATGLPLEQDDESGQAVPALTLRVNVLQAVWFTVHKIELLKALSAMDGPFNHGFRLNVRVANIQERFVRIRGKLGETGAMRELR